ncbi:MAG: GNAT family N-acetyltransferase [Deltaproteobacteria bacterium]|nr:MAG: GNAT family N-acetyltransferase [Deltaproteobacteria bacterium]
MPGSRDPARMPAGRVRRAEARDLDGVVALWSAIAAHHAPLDPLFALRRDAEPELRALLAALLRDPDAAIHVYASGRDIAGLCIVRIAHAPPILEETERAEITDLGVREDWRRRGVGRRLVEAALEWLSLRGIARVEVRVASRNPEGQAFWRALGWSDLMDVLQRRL